MNKKWIFGLIVLLLATLACSTITISPNTVTGSGHVISETRNVSGFDSLALEGSGNVSVAFGSNESVVVQADDNIIPLITTTVQNSSLVIRTKNNTNITTRSGIRISVTMKTIRGISLKGSGDINVDGLTGSDVVVELPGSGNITITGTANSVDISLPGSGNILCEGLEARDVKITLNGSGNITAYASESLDATLRGSGTIRYFGNPSQVNKSIIGSGTITP
jgi:hypothetical protein